MTKDLFQLPNLLSLSRVVLVAPIGYFLWLDDARSTVICAGIMVLAAITDGLDGYLARKLGKVSPLGIALDPIADKIFAGALVILLIWLRDLPVWLAAVIVGRDILILAAGSILLSGEKITLPSNLTGKYAFSAIAVLLASYIIHYDFGIAMMTWITIPLIVASLVNYTRVFVKVRAGLPVPRFDDRPMYRNSRIVLTLAVSAVYLIKLYVKITA